MPLSIEWKLDTKIAYIIFNASINVKRHTQTQSQTKIMKNDGCQVSYEKSFTFNLPFSRNNA